MKNIANFLLFIFLFSGFGAVAQDVEMADGLRSSGKIYVIVIIVMIVLLGLIVYLFSMDRKLSRIEKLIEAKKKTK
jgi:CcmD family protein